MVEFGVGVISQHRVDADGIARQDGGGGIFSFLWGS
jgi:hypothetical protein